MLKFSKVKIGLSLLAGLLVASAAIGQQFPTSPRPGSEDTLTPELKAAVLDQMKDIVMNRAYVPGADFSKWPEFVSKHQADIDKADTADSLARAMNESLQSFGFSHIVFATPKQATARFERKVVGIGVQLIPEDNGLRVMTVFDTAPAGLAGIQVGDLILEVDGKKLKTPAEMLGDEGSKVHLKVLKTDGKTKEYNLVRKKFSNVRPETLTWVDDQTAVLRIPTFDLAYDQKRVEGLVTDAQKAKNLIVDLRSNGGGAVVNLTHLMGLLLPEGSTLGTFVNRNMVKDFVKETGGKETDLPAIASWSTSKLKPAKPRVDRYKGNLAVLVDGGSGSAAEIAAAALQDDLDAPVIGTRSAGAVLVSVMVPLKGGFQLQYPISDYVTPHGVRLEGTGITPLVEAKPPRKFNDPDLGIERASALLHRISLRDNRGGG